MPARKLQELLSAETLDFGELESFALHNTWNPDDKSDLDKLSKQLQSLPENDKLKVLQVLQPAFEPGRFILDHYDYLISIVLNPSNLESGEAATKLLADTFRTYVPPDTEYQATLTVAARKILDTYVIETQGRWNTFEQIVAGKSVFEYNIPLDPNRIPKLEYVAFQYGMSNPLSFYNLLNELAVKVETRLHAFILLKLFLIVEDTPTYYLIDAELFGTIISSAVNDTDICIFQTAVTIITIFLPIVAVKSVSKLDDLLFILITAIKWEIWYPLVLKHASKTKEGKETEGQGIYDMDEILLNHSIGAIRTCVQQYYTVLYGMFPCNVLSYMSEYLNGNCPPPNITAPFGVAPDSLRKYFESARSSAQFDEKYYITQRIEQLIQSHKCHLNSILSTVNKERIEPWFLKKEPSDIIIACFQLYVKEFESDIELITKELETLDEVSAAIMRINTFLHGPIIQSDLPLNHSKADDEFNSVMFFRIYYFILMNEAFFKECMRQYHIMHIRNLRKLGFESEVEARAVENAELKLKSAINELESTISKNKELKDELDRLQRKQVYFENESNTQLEKLKYEVELKTVQVNSLTNKCEALKVEVKELKAANDSLQSYNPGLLNNLQMHNEKLKSEIEILKNSNIPVETKAEDRSELDAQIFVLQKRLQDCAFEIDMLKAKIDDLSQTERDYNNLKEEFSKCRTELDQKVKAGEEMSLLFSEELKAQEARYETVKKIMLQYQCKLMSIQNPQPEKQ
ncbi:hypothetical protein HDV06_002178 [Boothiomyces sp. JEL0866]|nr:hypothetical protein HDV06_002178 [Boothiomyces sp. JEL0866]